MRGILSLLVPAALSLAAPAAEWSGNSVTKALYFINNNDNAANNIVSMPIESDGSLGRPVLTPTGGKGLSPISTLATPAGIFFSQSSITTGGNYIFAVNPGSNTLSMFVVNPSNPTQPKLVAQQSTGGDFPMSVTYSEKLQKACVLNGGSTGGIMCYHVSSTGLTAAGKLRKLDAAFNQTTPPTGPVNTASQVLFSPDSSMLLAVIKGNPTTSPIQPGVFLTFPVTGTEIALNGIEAQVSDIILNFGSVFTSDDRFLIAAPTFGAAIVETSATGALTQVNRINVTSQRAICWTAYAPKLDYGYLYDAGRTTVEVVDMSTGALLTPIVADIPGNNGTQGGLYDTAIAHEISYSLADPDGVVALNLQTGKQIGYYNLSKIGTREQFEGMAIWKNKS